VRGVPGDETFRNFGQELETTRHKDDVLEVHHFSLRELGDVEVDQPPYL
jgi:hypothetical protein